MANPYLSVIKWILISVLIMYSGNVLWSQAAMYNIKYNPNLPWSILIGFVSIALWVAFFQGKIIPWRASVRQAYSGLVIVDKGTFIRTVVTGLSFSVSMISFLLLIVRVVKIPFSVYDLGEVNLLNKHLYLFMIALIAGITEEIAFRGYLQSHLSRLYSMRVTLVICSIVFSLVHAGHSEFVYLLPVYFFYSYYLGLLTTVAASVIPSIVVHVMTDFFIFMIFLHAGIDTLHRSLAITGFDGSFAFLLVSGVFGMIAGIYQLKNLARSLSR